MPPSQPRHRGRKFCTDRGAAYSLDSIFPLGYIEFVADVLFTGEFEAWWDGLSVEEQDSIDRVVWMLAEEGPALRFPYSSKIESSAYSHMRELRIQYQGRLARHRIDRRGSGGLQPEEVRHPGQDCPQREGAGIYRPQARGSAGAQSIAGFQRSGGAPARRLARLYRQAGSPHARLGVERANGPHVRQRRSPVHYGQPDVPGGRQPPPPPRGRPP